MKALLNRHKGKLVFLGTLVSGVWALGKFAQYKLQEINQQMEMDRTAKSK
jgi:hypothetical protein